MSDYSNSEIPNGLYYVDVAVLAKIFAERYGTSVDAAYEWLTKDIEVPSADVQPVVHGEWILSDNQRREDVDNDNYLYFCSQCLHSDLHAKSVTVSYCWNCGAKMDKRKGADE